MCFTLTKPGNIFVDSTGNIFVDSGKSINFAIRTGKMAEWSIATVLKTVEGHTSGGSNPSLSANSDTPQVNSPAACLLLRKGGMRTLGFVIAKRRMKGGARIAP